MVYETPKTAYSAIYMLEDYMTFSLSPLERQAHRVSTTGQEIVGRLFTAFGERYLHKFFYGLSLRPPNYRSSPFTLYIMGSRR